MADRVSKGARASAVRSSAPSLANVRHHRAELLALALRSGITGISVFGSVARGASTESSDIDLLVDADPETSYFTLASFALEAEALLGHPVDAVFRSGLRARRDDSLLRDEVPL
ncbi:nucleotidyltransferase family protein [Rathayibacter sp. VKM Ac-2857]|uniref:nucleotidyltransferase family protein n=1 Tax=Rathayibacter sp. VKM Ac-2857 TaxID=2739020 RepID=UPI001C206D21|nr:nucleotidyltransferase domain-containing protein [Rathayibacter sp. VKM Ac-2857]